MFPDAPGLSSTAQSVHGSSHSLIAQPAIEDKRRAGAFFTAEAQRASPSQRDRRALPFPLRLPLRNLCVSAVNISLYCSGKNNADDATKTGILVVAVGRFGTATRDLPEDGTFAAVWGDVDVNNAGAVS